MRLQPHHHHAPGLAAAEREHLALVVGHGEGLTALARLDEPLSFILGKLAQTTHVEGLLFRGDLLDAGVRRAEIGPEQRAEVGVVPGVRRQRDIVRRRGDGHEDV